MLAILQKELNSFFNSLVGYIVMIVFLTGTGLFMWVFPDTEVLGYGFATMETLFSMTPFVYLFLIPAITMRTFAEEKKAGTMELLLTRPLTDFQIIIGKYIASWLLVIFALLPTLIYYFSISALGTPQGNIDTAAVIGSYIGLFLLGAVFTSIGIFASSITDNQIVAFILSVFFCFILYTGFSSLAQLDLWEGSAYIVNQLGIDFHYAAMSKGLIDSRNLLYFFSIITIFLYLTYLNLRSRKW
ncbi:MAG: gliding motility-associated ABC transporter permease subunit GldF [Cytophagales bacterium]|nr:MAG: gliding motility-associated ABC transporter permease subunit GldF [Cytophagales bacterium]